MESVRFRAFVAASTTLALAWAIPVVRADGLAAAPIRLDIATTAKAEVLTLTNHGDAPGDIQVRAMAWRQDGDEDVHEPSDAIVVSPPRFTLAAGAKQTVRVYRRGAPEATERNYRVFVDQIPAGDATPGTVRLPIRLVIPLFVAGTQAGKADLAWQATRRADSVTLQVENRGDRHVRISRLALVPVDGGAAEAPPQLVYVLPGARRSVTLPRPPWLARETRGVRVVGEGDAGAIDARVDLLDVP